MDEKLRRLGLSSDATVDPLKGKGKELSDAYMEKIRTDQSDKRRVRREKQYRRYIANSDPYDSDHPANSPSGAEAKLIQNAVESARNILYEESKNAEEVVRERERKEMEAFDRAVRLEKMSVVEKHIFEESKLAASEDAIGRESEGALPLASEGFPGLQAITSSSSRVVEQGSIVEECRFIVRGLVELAFEVSGQRFLLEEEITGKPVRAVHQDLKVSDWRKWVNNYLYHPAAEVTQEVPPPSQQEMLKSCSFSNQESESLEKKLAIEQFDFVVQNEEKREKLCQDRALEDVFSILQSECRRIQKLAISDIRQAFEKSSEEDKLGVAVSLAQRDDERENTLISGQNSIVSLPLQLPVSRAEVLPRWTHRMPCAGYFIHGDDLSGVRLLVEAIERQVRLAGVKLGPGGDGAEAPPASPPPATKSHEKTATGPPHDKSIGITRVEDGVKRTYITPRTLLGKANPVAPSGASGPRGARHGGGGKGLPHHRQQHEDDERKDFEAMAEILARELASAHFHNLHQLSDGRIPSIAALPSVVDNTPRRGRTNKKEEPGPAQEPVDETLHCLYLVGFPENELFYHLLHLRLAPAVEAGETQIAVEQHHLDELASTAVALSSHASRARSVTTATVPVKPKSATVSSTGPKAKGSKNQVFEDTANLVAEQSAAKAFPPLCILGYFVEYDIPTRLLRLQNAYQLPGPSMVNTAPSKGNAQMNTVLPPTAIGGGAPPLFHPVFNPEIAGPMPLPSNAKESPSRSISERSINSSNVSAISVNGGAGTPCTRKKLQAADWDVVTAHRELSQRHSRMKAWQSHWRNTFAGQSYSTISSKTTSATAAAAPQRDKGKRRPTKGAAQTGKDSVVDVAVSDPGAAPKESFTFPKVLYFFERECVNDFGYDKSSSIKDEGTSGDTASFFIPTGTEGDDERSHVVQALLEKLSEYARPAFHPLTNAKLVTRMLPEPLRLADYRLPNELCHDLVRCFNVYEQKLRLQDKVPWPRGVAGGGATWLVGCTDGVPPPAAAFHLSRLEDPLHMPGEPYSAAKGEVQGIQTPATPSCTEGRLQMELSVYEVCFMHLKELFEIVSGEAFTAQIWGSTSTDLSSTRHFLAIDENAALLQERVKEVKEKWRKELLWRCAVFLRYAVDDALHSVAEAMETVFSWIQSTYFPVETTSVAPSAGIVNPPSTAPGSTKVSHGSEPLSSPCGQNPVHTLPYSTASSPLRPGEGASGVPSAESPGSEPEGGFLQPSNPLSPPDMLFDSATNSELPLPQLGRVCQEPYRLSQQDASSLVELLATGEHGLQRFWDAFQPYLIRIQQALEEEFVELLQYFTIHQRCMQAKATAWGIANSVSATSPLVPCSSRKAKVASPKRGIPKNKEGKVSDELGKSLSLTGVPLPTPPAPLELPVLPWCANHLDPSSELQWSTYAAQVVMLVVSSVFAAPGDGQEVYSSSDEPSLLFDPPPEDPHAACERDQLAVLYQLDATAPGKPSVEPIKEMSPGESPLREKAKKSCAVSPSLTRSLLIIKEVITCADVGARSTQAWLEVMYRTALSTPVNGTYPAEFRPTSVAQLFEVPLTGVENAQVSHESPSSGGPRALCYGWSRFNLELSLSALFIHGEERLRKNELVHSVALAQLSKLWMFLDINVDALAQLVGYTYPDAGKEGDESSPGRPITGHERRLSPSDTALLPDLLFLAPLLTSAPCRDVAWAGLPFLHLPEVSHLFENSVNASHLSSKETAALPLRQWLFQMLLHRCCFCRDPKCPYRQSHSLPLPSLRELRKAVSGLPEEILKQAHDDPRPALVQPYHAVRKGDAVQGQDQGVSLNWWDYENEEGSELTGGPKMCEAIKRSLTRLATCALPMTKNGLLRREIPSLNVVLRLLADSAVSREESIFRLFHCLASISRKSAPPQRFFEAGGAQSLAVHSVELSVADLVYFFGVSDGDGDKEARHASHFNAPDDTYQITLEEDAQLLMQVEHRDSIHLAMLLSSHWGRELVRTYLTS